MVTEKDILDAYVFLRRHNHSIPDEALDFIKGAAIDKLNAIYRERQKDKYEESDINHNCYPY